MGGDIGRDKSLGKEAREAHLVRYGLLVVVLEVLAGFFAPAFHIAPAAGGFCEVVEQGEEEVAKTHKVLPAHQEAAVGNHTSGSQQMLHIRIAFAVATIDKAYHQVEVGEVVTAIVLAAHGLALAQSDLLVNHALAFLRQAHGIERSAVVGKANDGRGKAVVPDVPHRRELAPAGIEVVDVFERCVLMHGKEAVVLVLFQIVLGQQSVVVVGLPDGVVV